MPTKPKTNYQNQPIKDMCGTPPYALTPLLQYLNPEWTVWECASGDGLLTNALKENGFQSVISTDITKHEQFDFLDSLWQPEHWDVLITNPPYSLKYKFIKRCFELGKPWALLMPTDTFSAATAANLFDVYGYEILFMTPRVDYFMPNAGWSGAGSQFSTAWYCHGLLPKQIQRADISAAKKKFKRELLLNGS